MALSPQTSVFRLLIVGAALLGALVVTHLGLQVSNEFANGCTGLASTPLTFDASAPAETLGCEEVTGSVYADFLGVSFIVWGLVFYGMMTALRLAYAATADDRLRLAAFGVSGVGLLVAASLVYIQAAKIGAFCPLCLTSSAIVLVLFVLHAIEHRRLASTPAATSRRAPAPRRGIAALRPYAPVLGLFAVLIGADVALASRSSDEPAPAPLSLNAPATAPPINGTALAGVPAGTPVAAPVGTCAFDANIAPIADLASLTTGPFIGSADADAVTVVEIFDPNCPHCRDLAEMLEPVKASLGDRARFYSVAYPLREQSIAQVIALNMAKGGGTYEALVAEMFRRQDNTWGMSLPELVTALNAVGMDGPAFQATLQDQTRLQPFLTQVQADAATVGAAFQSRDGGISTPRVAIGNRVIAPQSLTAACLEELVDQARTDD